MNDEPETGGYFEVEALRKSFGAREVLRGVDVTAPRGGVTVILGGSGAGKSVLLKHLNGLLRPDSGVVRVKGVEISRLSERELTGVRRRIGILFQDGALFDSMTVEENVAFPLREHGGRNGKAVARRVGEVLELVGLEGEGGKLPAALSGGMRKRAALARAMAPQPECLLYDEPTAGLDPVLSQAITDLILRMRAEFGITSVVVTHDLQAMRTIADQVLFLAGGEVRFAGDADGLESCPDEAIRRFLTSGSGAG